MALIPEIHGIPIFNLDFAVQKSDVNYPGATAWIIWSGLTQTLKMKDILSSKIKDKSFIFNRLPEGQKVQMELFGFKKLSLVLTIP